MLPPPWRQRLRSRRKLRRVAVAVDSTAADFMAADFMADTAGVIAADTVSEATAFAAMAWGYGLGYGLGYYPYAYGAYGCWRTVRVLTPIGPRFRRVWVCG